MYEIRFHGRGGQGRCRIDGLASAFFKEKKFVQAFPSSELSEGAHRSLPLLGKRPGDTGAIRDL